MACKDSYVQSVNSLILYFFFLFCFLYIVAVINVMIIMSVRSPSQGRVRLHGGFSLTMVSTCLEEGRPLTYRLISLLC